MNNRNTQIGIKIYFLFLFFGFNFLLAVTNTCHAQGQASTDAYPNLVKSADQALAAKDYATALMLYTKASYAKPELKYASGKISEINTLLDATPDARATLFENIIIDAENFYKQKEYAKAKQEYQKALAIDPSAQFPKDRLGQITAVYTDPTDLAYYNDAVTNGDKAFAAHDYDKAILFYETALAVKPDAKVVKEKITNSKKQQSDTKIRTEQSAKIIQGADKLLQAEKRTEARAEYQKALDLTPGNTYASQKIQEIDKFVSDKKNIQDNYDKAIELADQFYINRDFANARIKYQEALKVKPDARYPKEMLDKTLTGETQLLSDQQRYEAALASAATQLKEGNYEGALSGYKSASALQPAETLPKTKIAEIEKLISERATRKEAYDIALKNGDQALGEKKYDPALAHFRNALSLQPGEKYPQQKIDEITTLISAQKAVDENYTNFVLIADKLLAQSKLTEALAAYTKALELKPDEAYPEQKITEIQNLIAVNKSIDENYASALLAADKSYAEMKYEEALVSYKQALTYKPAEKYPRDKSDEISKILAKQKSETEQYNLAISSGEKALQSENYAPALAAFQEALKIKPGETYPLEKIAEINLAMAAQQKINEKYTTAINTGDQLFATKDFARASVAYGEASELKKNEKYPIEQIGKIDKILADARSADENYSRAIADGDDNFNKQNFTEAITAYKKASLSKPAETYPTAQIEKINALVAEQKKLDTEYAAALIIADKSFAAQKYDEAIAGYRNASNLKPSEKYPADKVAECEKLVSDLKILQENYNKTLAEGEKFLAAQDHSNALASFKSAAALKPAETYPKQKIAEIQAIIDKDKAEGQRYQEAITEADKLYNEQNYTAALGAYQHASGIKPSEKYPQDQAVKINQLVAEQKKLETEYQNLLADGEARLKESRYDESRSLFTQAGVLKPAEKLPKTKIAEIDAILTDLQNKETSFTRHISEGDASLEAKKLNEAIVSYSNALQIKPLEAYPKAQIEKINLLIADEKKLEAEYAAVISAADMHFAAKKYDEAIASYQKALALKPAEKYPSDKIAESGKLSSDLKALQESYDKAIANGDNYYKEKDFPNALTAFANAGTLKPAEAYPKQKVVEIQAILDKNKADSQRYQEAVEQAGKLFSEAKYNEALKIYQLALGIKPDEKFPQEQIVKINQLLEDQKKLDADYLKLITDADTRFKEAKYEESRTLYTNAGNLKPAEKLPKDKVTEIDKILEGIQQKELSYTTSVKEGDAFFADKKYAEAIISYTKALTEKPTESYPKAQIDKTNALLAEQKKLDDNYLAFIADADGNFDAKKYTESILSYKKALSLKPTEKYPTEKIAEAEKQLADLKALKEAYEKALAEGNGKLAEKEYENSLLAFKKANSLMPDEIYPTQKITEIQAILDKNKAENDRYLEAISLGDKFFEALKYREALEPYQRATTIKPGEKYPQEKITQINQYLAEQKKLDDDYQNLLTQAATSLASEKYDEARVLYSKAAALKPSEMFPKEKIAEIDKSIADLKLKDENYTKAINSGSGLYSSKDLSGALKSYEEAVAIKPLEKFPQERILTIKAELKAMDENYSKAVTLGNTRFESQNLMEALNAYQSALEIKPAEEYPKTRIAEINTLLSAQKEEQDKLYASYVAEGDKLSEAKDYTGAKSSFTKANGIKPAETYPKQKIAEIDKILEEIALARRAEYTKALGEADKLYTTKIFDQAIDAYEAASKINPGDSYPVQQIGKIRKYMADHAIQDLFAQTLLISEGNEKKFTFSAIELRQRKNNYILLKARSAGKTAPKVFLNYGKDSQKNGGIVLRSLDKTETSDYLIRISVQDKWYREDNNWISLFVETGEIEISKVQIAAGDE